MAKNKPKGTGKRGRPPGSKTAGPESTAIPVLVRFQEQSLLDALTAWGARHRPKMTRNKAIEFLCEEAMIAAGLYKPPAPE